MLIRAYTGPVSPCRFSPKTAKNSNRPNPRPPQVLAQFRKALCHLMSPSDLQHLRASNEAACRLAMDDQQRCPVSLPLHAPAPPRPHRASSPRPQAPFTKNHPNHEPPQPMPATTLASEKNRVCHYMSPSILQLLRAPGARPSARARRIYECPRAPPPPKVFIFLLFGGLTFPRRHQLVWSCSSTPGSRWNSNCFGSTGTSIWMSLIFVTCMTLSKRS